MAPDPLQGVRGTSWRTVFKDKMLVMNRIHHILSGRGFAGYPGMDFGDWRARVSKEMNLDEGSWEEGNGVTCW